MIMLLMMMPCFNDDDGDLDCEEDGNVALKKKLMLLM